MGFRLDRLTLRIVAGVSAIVALMLGIGLMLISEQYRAREAGILQQGVQAQAELLESALEHAMLQRDPGLLREMLAHLAGNRNIENAFVVNRDGVVKFASDPSLEGTTFSIDSPDCQACHTMPVQERPASVALASGGGQILRVVRPVHNRPACHGCHDASVRINGMVVIDAPISAQMTELAEDVRAMSLWTLAVGIALLAGITAMVRRLVLVRLRSLERTARAFASGDLGERARVSGDDPVGRLGREFNAMAESISGLLGRLDAQKRRLENVMNSVDDGMIVLDLDLRVVACNQAFLRRIGAGRDQVLARLCTDVAGLPCRNDDRGGRSGCAARMCLAEGAVGKGLRTWVDPAGREHVEEVFASPIRGEDGRVEQIVEVWRDITDRRSVEAQVAEFHRLASLGLLASGISHEVNTPLATVLTCMDSVSARVRGSPAALGEEDWAEIRECVDLVRGEVMRVKTITRRLLAFARSRSAEPDILHVDELVRGVLPLVRKMAADAGVAVEVEAAGAPPVLAPAGPAHQVVLNLLVNAVQACESGGRVRVNWAAEADALRLRVTDDGHGIPADSLGRVFEPFFTTRPGGTGLGLFVSLGLARGWGGDIAVESAAGVGSTFEVRFPHPPAEGAGVGP